MKKRKVALLMAVVLVLQMLPLPSGVMAGVFDTAGKSRAADLSGTDGNISWTLTPEAAKDGWTLGSKTPYKLTLSGTGNMNAYNLEKYTENNMEYYRTTAPWEEHSDQIQTISVGSGITSISSYAFYNCNSALSVEIPAGVTCIDNYAFYGCNGLKQVTLPEGVTTIGSSAFHYCTDMEKINIPDSVASIGSVAFGNCSSLEEVSIPASVESIPYMTFYNCKKMEKLRISEGVKTIGDCAFAYCESLTTLSLPENSLTTLKEECFSYTGLVNFDVPASVTTIENNPCVGGVLEKITVAQGNGDFAVYNGMLVQKKDSEAYQVISYPCKGNADVIVPDPIKIIGKKAFYGANIQSVDLPGSLLEIGESAFYYIDTLKGIDVPGNVAKIDSYSFYGCSALQDVKLGGDVQTIGDYAFAYCKKLKEFVLPDKMTSIGDGAFSGCSKLEELVFPNSLVEIGESVLSNCTSLERVSFGQKIQRISGNVFRACPKLAQISISSKNPNMTIEDNVIYSKDKTTLIYYAAGLENDRFLIPDTVTTVGSYAFTYCVYLEELRIPDTVTELGYYGIYHNETLGKLLFYGNAPSVTEYCQVSTKNNVKYYNAYNTSIYKNKVKNGDYDNTGLVIFKIQNSTGWEKGWEKTDKYTQYESESTYTWEQNYIFSTWDPEKTDVAQGDFDGLTWNYRDDIGELTFSGEGKIPDFTQDNLPTWSNDEQVDHRQDVKLIDTGNATEVGNYTFYGMGKILRILSGEQLDRIGQSALGNCISLKIVQVQSAARIEKEAFSGDTAIQEELDLRGAELIGDSAFHGCTAMTDVLLGEGLKKLEQKAFMDCQGLETLILPESLTALGENCFNGCKALRSINIPKGVSAMPGNCFADCSDFQKIYFYGDCPDTWDDTAFEGTHSDFTIYYRKGNTTWDSLGNAWNGIPVVGLDKFYTQGEDHYSFTNASSSFGYGSRYFIPRQRYVTALQSIIRGSYYYAWDSSWRGSCFGMAASSTEFYQGDQFDVKDYSATANTLFDVKAPKKSNADLTKLVEIYQVSQYADEIGGEVAGNFGKYRKLIKQVEEFERSGGLEIDSTADPVVMCVYSDDSGHALVPVSVNMDAEGNYILEVYDCNYSGKLQKLTIKKDFSGINYGEYKSASFVKYSTIREVLREADFTGESLKKSSDESSKVSVAVNRKEVQLVNGGGKDFEEIKGAYEQRPVSDSSEASLDGIRSFVLPQGEYQIQDASGEKQQDELKYYVSTEDLFSEIETSDEDATLTVKSVKGTGYDVVTLSSERSDTESVLTVMDVSGIKREISVTGSDVSVEMVNDKQMKLSVSEDTSSVKVDGEETPISGKETTLSFYASQGDNPMEINDMLCDISLDENDRLSGTAEAYVTWTRKDAQDVDVTTKVKDEEGNVIAEYEKKINLKFGMQKVNVTLNKVKTNLSHLSGEFQAVCEMTLVDAEDHKVQVTCSDITLKASEKNVSPEPIKNPTPSPVNTESPAPDNTKSPDVTKKPSGETEKTEASKKPKKKSSLPKKGKIKTVGALKYIVLKSAKKNGTVAVYGAKKKTAKSITIPKKVKMNGYSFKVVAIYKNAFSKMRKLSKVVIGANVKNIGDNAFKNCRKIEFIIIPGKVTTIGKKSFAGCTGLHYILVKSGKIKSVGRNAFQGVDSKTTVKTPGKKWRKYADMFMNKGKMSQHALFIINPVKLKYKGKSY